VISLSAVVSAHGAHAMARAREIRRDAFVATGEQIIDGTPIKTGLARGNWQTSIKEAITDAIPVRPASEAKRELSAIADEALADETLVLANNAAHIVRLEYGWSAQAPEGMFRLALLRWDQNVAEAETKNT
jgi:hypothetical protein